MPRSGDENGSSYLRIYCALEESPTEQSFAAVCAAQDLPTPSRRMFSHIRRLYRARERHYIPMNQLDVRLSAALQAWTLERLQQLVERAERERADLDFKQQVGGDSSTRKAWAAMANSGGGVVVYGVVDRSTAAASLSALKLYGVEERLRQLNQAIDPPVALEIDVIPEPTSNGELGYVVVRCAPAARGLVHLVDHRAPSRDGATTRYLTSEELRRWIGEGPAPRRTRDAQLPF